MEKKWQAELKHNKINICGGLFDDEKQAAMKVNLLCDKYQIERKNPMINLGPDEIQQVPTQTSKYAQVYWNKYCNNWKVQLTHKMKKYNGGTFEKEEHAAMKVNLLCDICGIERKNPTINIEPNAIQQKTKSKIYQSKEKSIVCEKVKVEDKNILNGFKDECENRFIKSNDKESYIATASCQSQKRKRKDDNSIMNDVKQEKVVEIATPDYDQNEVLLVEEIQNYYTHKVTEKKI